MILIINEKVEVMEYLQGKNLSKTIQYRICLLLAKWFYGQGATSVIEIREHIFEWAKQNNFYITVSVNNVAARVIREDMHLLGQEPVYINDYDINEITKRFNTYYERKVALGILCYAKIYMHDNKFNLSQAVLAKWLQMHPRTVRKYLDRLTDCNFISLYDSGIVKVWYDNVVNQLNVFTTNLELVNEGEYQLIDNDIDRLYREIFEAGSNQCETWYPVTGYDGLYEVSSLGRVKVHSRTFNGRSFPAKVLRACQSSSGKDYVYLFDNERHKQIKVNVETLLAEASKVKPLYVESNNVSKKERQIITKQ